jgi:purine-binding chemotaxis protein CheW
MIQQLIFEVNGHLFSIDIKSVKEIIRNVRVEPIPSQPEFIEGIINFRGVFVPVLDLKKMLFNIETELDLNKRIIVIHMGDNLLSVMVDSVKVVYGLEIIEKEKGLIENVLIESHYLKGISKYNDIIVYALETETILDKKQSKKILDFYNKKLNKIETK